ncbi:heavy metal translocating P-type ATPase [Chitinophaga filiformis]|uniref:P-type Zn(2+) transporter n=1 Tax=Chitinophaga filiformis TaxID=104663 RepID=A0ABY4IBL3_CHIFI|nr:heavy metal translocating P-type ATPase [Chitinophaga filiformis]UPK72191.1 heavy metal translocating P-type ATPase [Chitinophaga filiformis]
MEQHSKQGHSHAHGGIFGHNTELIFSIICGICLGIGFGLHFIETLPAVVPLICYIAAYFFGGFFTAKEAVTAIGKGEFEIDFLMLVAAAGAGILGDWAEGALLLSLFSLGHALEHYAMGKAKRSIAALAELTPKTALLKSGQEVDVETLKTGDIILIKPDTKIPADGIIIAGNSSVNQAPITGESIPVEKQALADPQITPEKADKLEARYRVFAGTINGNGSLEVMVSRLSSGSTIARLIKLVNEAQSGKSPSQRFTDKVQQYYVPAVLILVTALCFAFLVIDEPFSKSFYRAMSVLVAASPCALAIATPSAVLSGVARAARSGVLIKGGRPLEDLGTLTALAFDKTGTLTEGRPKLTNIISLNGASEEELLQLTVAVESLSDHPLGKAIVKDSKTRLHNAVLPAVSDLRSIAGKGISAKAGNDTIVIGNPALFEKEQLPQELAEKVARLQESGNTSMIVRRNEDYIGLIAVMDTPREEARQVLQELRAAGIRRMIMLTGDNQQVADAVAAQTGLTEAWGDLLPEEKVAAIKKLKQDENKVAMIGDGVNDAPAMANSTVGIAMGAAGSDVALETADIALMGDKLSLLPFAIRLSRQAKSIIRQNLVFSLGMVAVLIPLTMLGIASIGPAIIAHEGSTLLVVFNALRLLVYKDQSGKN